MPHETAELTRAIASGDPEAFSSFYRDYFDHMYHIARHATHRDEAFCMDIVQDAMLRVIRALPVIEHEPSLRAWLRRTVLSCAYDRLRSESRQVHAQVRESDRRNALTNDDTHDPDHAQRMQWIERELAAMDEHSSTLLLMRHRFGWSLKRIAREFGLTPGAVDGRLKRLINSLRKRAKDTGND